MSALGEAIRAIFSSCNVGIVSVGVLAVLAARGSLKVLGAVVASAIVGGWLFAQNVSLPFDNVDGTVTHAIVLLAACVGVFFLRHRPWYAAALAGAAQFVAVAWWQPCVGLALADVLNADGFGPRAFPMAMYMIGLLVPTLVVAAALNVLLPASSDTAGPVPNAVG